MNEGIRFVLAYIQHAAFSHILIADHDDFNLRIRYQSQSTFIFTWTGSYIVRPAVAKKAKNISRSLEILPSFMNQKEPKELKFVFSYFSFSFAVLLAEIKVSAALMSSLSLKENAR